MEEIDLMFLEIEEKMEKALESYNANLVKISVGRANPQILNSIKINYYGELTPINEIANISVPQALQLLIKPYQNDLVKQIIQALSSSNLHLNYVDEGDKVRITFPEVTTERRKELVKMFGQYTEQAKVSIRGARHEILKMIKELKLSEDEEKNQIDKVQKLTNRFIEKTNQRSLEKKAELMQM